jgi:hypothetical protein
MRIGARKARAIDVSVEGHNIYRPAGIPARAQACGRVLGKSNVNQDNARARASQGNGGKSRLLKP